MLIAEKGTISYTRNLNVWKSNKQQENKPEKVQIFMRIIENYTEVMTRLFPWDYKRDNDQ